MSRLRTFFLQTTPDAGPPALVPQDREQALKVLRVRPGDHLVGIDGQGHAWELEVTRAERRRLQLDPLGPPRVEPAPGSAPGLLPWIEVWAPLPKRDRAEDLMGQLTQLGLARYVPLTTFHTEPQARELPESRETRLLRRAQESLKQCGRLWMPEIGPVTPLKGLDGLPGTTLAFHPGAPARLSEFLAESTVDGALQLESPIRLVFGPEGGLSEQELDFLVDLEAKPLRLSPHVLRIETAALAALATLAERWS